MATSKIKSLIENGSLLTWGTEEVNIVIDGTTYEGVHYTYIQVNSGKVASRYFRIGCVLSGTRFGTYFLLYESWSGTWKAL